MRKLMLGAPGRSPRLDLTLGAPGGSPRLDLTLGAPGGSPRLHLPLLLLLALALCPLRATAQPRGGFTMPLASPDLPDGVLTVKVVGSGMEDRRVGQAVSLLRAAEGGKLEPQQTVKTGEDGRARFERLAAGVRYVVQVDIDGQRHQSEAFDGPGQGGLRLLLSLGEGPAMPGMGAPAEGMPPGHPPASQPALPPGHPPAGEPPPGAGQSGAAHVSPAPDLAPGQVLVRVVKGSPPQPVAGAVVIGPLAAGGAHSRTDAEGKLTLQLRAAQPRSGPPSLSVIHDGISYRSDALQLPAQGGLEVTFTVYDRSRDLGALSIAPGSQLTVQPGEGALQVMEVLHLLNRSQKLVDAEGSGLGLPLPRGAREIEIPDDEKDLLVVEAERKRLRFVTPIPPGITAVRIFFELPYRGSEVDFSQPLPLQTSEIMATVRGKATLFGPSVKGTGEGDSGEQFVLAPIAANRALEFTVGGLPHRDRRATLASIGLAGLLALWAVGAALGGPRRAQLRRGRREELIQQLAQLQRSKHRDDASAARRRELLAELRQIWDEPGPDSER